MIRQTMKTSTIKRVLIALDYDKSLQKIAESGFSLAKAMDAEVVLLHVITDPVYYALTEYSPIMGFTGEIDLGPIQLDSIDGLKKASNHFLEKIKHHLGDDTIKTILKDGDFAESIITAAREEHADLIVMGSHSRRWLDDILMGSVTEKVLHLTTLPMYIIPIKRVKE